MSLELDALLRIYCEKNSTAPPSWIPTIESSTQLNTIRSYMSSDHIQGRLLSFLAKMIQPNLVLEIGTFSGYGTCCIAEGLAEGGKVITIERDTRCKEMIEKHLKMAGIQDCVEVIYGGVPDALPELEQPYDMVYIDAAKKHYKTIFEKIIEQVRPGGLILADNTLWKREVLHRDHDTMTEAIHRFNVSVANDPRVQTFLLPYRDGITLMLKN
ncbi:MAG: O-methyltransferase [Bacteroidota bacterium]